uniref:Uncharacterized protein n=1 Tax=Anguilla anguilla TaxID=7936 RepID=A0A0E9WL11_ANGAN
MNVLFSSPSCVPCKFPVLIWAILLYFTCRLCMSVAF